METFISICGFVGAWLLVAGPVYQAALELREEEVEYESIGAVRKQVVKRRISAWWWLLPPVKIILERRRSKQYRTEFLAALPDKDVEAMVSFINKASGWLYVALGGLLLAVNETYALVHELNLGIIWFWVGIVAMALACVANTASRIARSEKLVKRKDR